MSVAELLVHCRLALGALARRRPTIAMLALVLVSGLCLVLNMYLSTTKAPFLHEPAPASDQPPEPAQGLSAVILEPAPPKVRPMKGSDGQSKLDGGPVIQPPPSSQDQDHRLRAQTRPADAVDATDQATSAAPARQTSTDTPPLLPPRSRPSQSSQSLLSSNPLTVVCALRDRSLQRGLPFTSEFVDTARMLVDSTPWRTIAQFDEYNAKAPLCRSTQVHGDAWPLSNLSTPAAFMRALGIDAPPDQRTVDAALKRGDPAVVQDEGPASTLPDDLRNSPLPAIRLEALRNLTQIIDQNRAQEGRVLVECSAPSCDELQRTDPNMLNCSWTTTTRWFVPGCQHTSFVRSPRALARCMASRSMLFIGDSTIRGQFARIGDLLGFLSPVSVPGGATLFGAMSALEIGLLEQNKDGPGVPSLPYAVYTHYWPPKNAAGWPAPNATLWELTLPTHVETAVMTLVNSSLATAAASIAAGGSVDVASLQLLRPTTFVFFGLFAEPWLIELAHRSLVSAYRRVPVMLDEAVRQHGVPESGSQMAAVIGEIRAAASAWPERAAEGLDATGSLPAHVMGIVASKRPRRTHAMVLNFAAWEEEIRRAAAKFGFHYVDQLTPSLTLWGRSRKPDFCRCHFVERKNVPGSHLLGEVNDIWVDQVLNIACAEHRA